MNEPTLHGILILEAVTDQSQS